MAKLKVEYIALGDLQAYERNTRTHSSEQVAQLVASIREFGFTNPVLVDEHNVLIAGHGRTAAAQTLGMDRVPAIRLTGLTEAQKNALRIADNALALNAGWDEAMLKVELEALESAGFNLDLLGLPDDLALAQLQEDELDNVEVFEDDVPDEDAVETRTQPGDIWLLGEHRLMCGDSTNPDAVAQLMDGESADLWLTDPPYNVAYEGKTKDALTIENDSMASGAFRAFLTDAFRAATARLKPGGAFYIWHADSEGFNFRVAVHDTPKLLLKQCLVWVKNTIVLGRQDYQWKHEPCLYGWKDGASHYFVGERTHATVVEEDRPDLAKMSKAELLAFSKELLANRDAMPTSAIYEDKPARNAEHPTMKPVKLFARLIRNSSRMGEVVLDTFGGSGTTIVACEQLARRARLMELDPHYCDVIIARWEKLTGKTANRLSL